MATPHRVSETISLIEAVHHLREARGTDLCTALSEIINMLGTGQLPPAAAVIYGAPTKIEPGWWWASVKIEYPNSSAVFNLVADGEPRITRATEIRLDSAAWERAHARITMARRVGADYPLPMAADEPPAEVDRMRTQFYPAPNWPHWLARDRWRLDAAIALSLGIDPAALLTGNRVRMPDIITVALLPAEFSERLQLAQSCADRSLPVEVRSALHPDGGGVYVEPVGFAMWAIRRKGLPVPPELHRLADRGNDRMTAARPKPTAAELDAWMRRVKRGDKRDDTIQACHDQIGATFRMAAEAWDRVPDELKLKRGQRAGPRKIEQ